MRRFGTRQGVVGALGRAAGGLGILVSSATALAQEQAPAAERPGFKDVLAQPGGLTASAVARRAFDSSVEGSVQHQAVVSAGAGRDQTFWQALPSVTLSASATRLSEVTFPDIFQGLGPAGAGLTVPRSNYLLNANLVVPLSDYLLRTLDAIRGADANVMARELDEQAARLTAASTATLTYYEWVLARLAGVLSQQAVDQAKAQLARIEALEAAGRAAHADVLSAQVFVADSELSLSQIELQHSVAAQRLRIAISASPDETLAVGEDVLAPFAGEREAGSLEALCREAYQQRLELRALAASRSSLERLSSIESSRALPTLEAFGNLTYANPNQRVFPQEQRWTDTWDVGVRLVWTLNNVGTSLATGRSVEADANALSAQQRSVEQALRLEIATALGGLEQARLNVGTAQKGEEAAGAAWEARRLLHEHGRATALELMQAETATLQARLNLISAHVSLRSARVRLDHALGRDVSLVEAQTAAPR